MFAGHLGHKAVGRFTFGLGPDQMMDPKKLVPIRLVGGPIADLLEVACSVCQLIGAPSEEKDIFHRAELKNCRVEPRHPEDDKARPRAFHLTVQNGGDLFGDDLFQTGENDRIAGRRRGLGSEFRHGLTNLARQAAGHNIKEYHRAALAASFVPVILQIRDCRRNPPFTETLAA